MGCWGLGKEMEGSVSLRKSPGLRGRQAGWWAGEGTRGKLGGNLVRPEGAGGGAGSCREA